MYLCSHVTCVFANTCTCKTALHVTWVSSTTLSFQENTFREHLPLYMGLQPVSYFSYDELG